MLQKESVLRIGCAGWTIPGSAASLFPEGASHLERYAKVFSAVEINSSFYRSHKPTTYRRWAQSVPEDFRFSVKVPKIITHIQRLKNSKDSLRQFLSEASALGSRLGPFLFQLPPSLVFDPVIASTFFETFRQLFDVEAVCEPRHPSWFEPQADALLRSFKVARVGADPAPVPEGANPGGFTKLVYFRLHGSPRKYYSSYPPKFLKSLSQKLSGLSKHASIWCIFDNTAAGAAIPDALTLMKYAGLKQ